MARINFRKESNRQFINEIASQMNREDKNWEWSVPIIRENEVCLFWGYLKYMEAPEAYFTIKYDEDMDFFSVENEHHEDITEELEDNIDLKSTMRSVFWYATSRY